jgi:hypothetical protein
MTEAKNHRRMQHFLYFFPLPQGHGSFLPMRGAERAGPGSPLPFFSFVYPAQVVTICLCRYSG